jgi:Protein of unknown function (DUF2795)
MTQRTNPAQVQKFLKDVPYPASKHQYLETARREGADRDVLQALHRLPERELHGPQAISEALGQAR